MQHAPKFPDLDAIDGAVDAGQVVGAAIVKNLTRLVRQLAGSPLPPSAPGVQGQMQLFDERPKT